jgi:alkylmercury lyase
MPTTRPDIPALAAAFTAVHPKLEPDEQRLALTAFRLLGEGKRFTVDELAARAGVPAEVLDPYLDTSMIHHDEGGQVVALGGLTLEPTSHSLEVDGRTLYAWCALDTLFLPELLGRSARVRSTSPETGEAISLTVDSEGVRDISPEGAVMTLHDATGLDLGDVVGTFCCYVNFFASGETAEAWAKDREGTYVVSIEDGFEYGRLYNQGQFGAALADAA